MKIRSFPIKNKILDTFDKLREPSIKPVEMKGLNQEMKLLAYRVFFYAYIFSQSMMLVSTRVVLKTVILNLVQNPSAWMIIRWIPASAGMTSKLRVFRTTYKFNVLFPELVEGII